MSLNYLIPPNWPFLGTWESNETFIIVVSDLAGNLNVSQSFALFGDKKPDLCDLPTLTDWGKRLFLPRTFPLRGNTKTCIHGVVLLFGLTLTEIKFATKVVEDYQKTEIAFVMPSNFSLAEAEYLSSEHIIENSYSFFVEVEGKDRFGDVVLRSRYRVVILYVWGVNE